MSKEYPEIYVKISAEDIRALYSSLLNYGEEDNWHPRIDNYGMTAPKAHDFGKEARWAMDLINKIVEKDEDFYW